MSGEKSLLGSPHKSKPETDSDKEMSKRHKANRKMIDKMEDGPDKLRKSISYNILHRDQHQEALVKAHKKLRSMGR